MSKIFLEQKLKLNKDVEKLIKYKIIIESIVFLILQVGLFVFLSIFNNNYKFLLNIIWGVILFVTYIAFYFWKTKLYVANYSYSINDEEIIIQEGYLSKEKTYIPYNIIQNVDINNGPIMRKYAYSHITIKVMSNEYHLKYIKNEIAEDIKNAILDNKNKYKFKF